MQQRDEIEIGSVITEMIDVYRAHAGPLLGAAAAVFVVVGLLQAALYSQGGVIEVSLGSIAGLIGLTLYTGFVVKLVEDVRDGRRDFTVGELFGSAAGALGSLLANAVIKAVLVVIGLFLLIVPGLYVLTIWAVTAPVIVVERVGAIAAFNRSGDLIRGRGWTVFAIVVVTFLIGVVIASVFSALGSVGGDAGQLIFGTVGSIVAAPITALVAAILYFRLAATEAPATGSPPASAG